MASYFTIFSEIIQFNLKFIYTIAVFNLIFFQKYFTLLAKRFNRFVDLVFEICLDSKFPVWRKILKDVYHNYKFH